PPPLSTLFPYTTLFRSDSTDFSEHKLLVRQSDDCVGYTPPVKLAVFNVPALCSHILSSADIHFAVGNYVVNLRRTFPVAEQFLLNSRVRGFVAVAAGSRVGC